MTRRILVDLYDELDARVEAYRDKHYPKMTRGEAVRTLVEVGLSRPIYNDATAKRALHKALCEINQAKEIVRIELERLEL